MNVCTCGRMYKYSQKRKIILMTGCCSCPLTLTDYSHSLYCREKRGVSWPTTIWQTPSPFPNPVPLYRRQRASECVNGSMGKAKGGRERKNDTLQEDNHWAIKWRLRICLTMLQTQACKNTRAQETTHKHCWITTLPNDIGSINVLYIS